MTKRALLFLLVLPACPPANSTSEGPEILFRVSPTMSSNFTNETLQPRMSKDIDTMNYEFTLEVDANFGETLTGTQYTYALVNELEGSMSPPGTALTEADFMVDTTLDSTASPRFLGPTMYTLPGTMMGTMLEFTMQATDEEGLRSNAVSFTALLD